MGGLAGHMSHLYENPNLSFSEIKDILQKASQGELQGTEKTDGQNLYISYSVKDGKAKSARNKGNIKGGGLDAKALAQKFSEHPNPNLVKAFVDAFTAVERAVKMFPEDVQMQITDPSHLAQIREEEMNILGNISQAITEVCDILIVRDGIHEAVAKYLELHG